MCFECRSLKYARSRPHCYSYFSAKQDTVQLSAIRHLLVRLHITPTSSPSPFPSLTAQPLPHIPPAHPAPSHRTVTSDRAQAHSRHLSPIRPLPLSKDAINATVKQISHAVYTRLAPTVIRRNIRPTREFSRDRSTLLPCPFAPPHSMRRAFHIERRSSFISTTSLKLSYRCLKGS